jgi:hypothetical protein
MNKLNCKLERTSNVTIGLFLLLTGLFFVLIGVMVIPVIGLIVALPFLVLAGIFLLAPRSKTCSLILDKAQSALSDK